MKRWKVSFRDMAGIRVTYDISTTREYADELARTIARDYRKKGEKISPVTVEEIEDKTAAGYSEDDDQ